jgi:pimeloyl-ACP methyl ester carboxylesterase
MAITRRAAVLAATITFGGVLVTPAPGQGVASSPLSAPRATAYSAKSTLHWSRCRSFELRVSGARCATLRVPLNYGSPHQRMITLALARVKHSAGPYKGVMLTNPGGPGGAGRYLATLGESVPHNVGAHYDWIGIDPRGTGASKPRVSCGDEGYFGFDRPNYNATHKTAFAKWVRRTKKYDAACAKHNGRILNHLTTKDSARDMDSIRKALGVRRISYYGYSYGTYLGQVYATLFPGRIKRMVLDSNVDPRRVWYGANLDQDGAFQHNSQVWFRWIAHHAARYHLGPTEKKVQQRWYHIRARLAGHADHGIGPDEWTDLFLDAEYYRFTWAEQAVLFANYAHHNDYSGLRRKYRGANSGDGGSFAMYNAVQCTDVQWPTSWQRWLKDNSRIAQKAPFMTWQNFWFNAPCKYWPAAAHKPVHITGADVPRTLLVDQTKDAATPYSGSLEVRRLFANSRLIALPGGTSHADSLSGNSCLDDRIAAYLSRGRLPARKSGNRADATCRPRP